MAFVSSPVPFASTSVLKSSFVSSRPCPTTLQVSSSRAKRVRMTASEPDLANIVLDENIGGFCSINPRTGKRAEITIRDKESIFLDAMQGYFSGNPTLSNAEFDALKEELTWQGSDVVTLNREEFRFLEAVKAYETGKPNMPNEEFDKLKKELQDQGSIVSLQRGPRCSIERQITFSDVVPDKSRTFLLYVPAGAVTALFWLSLAFELTPLRQLDPVLSLILGSPIIYFVAKALTGLVVPDATIMVGDCPSCGRRVHVLFGNVLNNAGFADIADVKCNKCKAKLKVEKESNRMILLAEGK